MFFPSFALSWTLANQGTVCPEGLANLSPMLRNSSTSLSYFLSHDSRQNQLATEWQRVSFWGFVCSMPEIGNISPGLESPVRDFSAINLTLCRSSAMETWNCLLCRYGDYRSVGMDDDAQSPSSDCITDIFFRQLLSFSAIAKCRTGENHLRSLIITLKSSSYLYSIQMLKFMFIQYACSTLTT